MSKWLRAAVALTVLSAPAIGSAQSNPDGGKPHAPSPEAVAACKDKSEGDTCDFDAPHGHVDGVCRKVHTGDLACVHPHHHPDAGTR